MASKTKIKTFFSDSFIKNLPDNNALAGKKICDEFERFHASLPEDEEGRNYEGYLEAFAIMQAYLDAHGITNFEYPGLTGDPKMDMNQILEFFADVQGLLNKKFTESTFEQYKMVFQQRFAKGFFYEFSKGDLKRIQTLINELRKLISASKELDEDHKLRLIKRLEKLQSELHKRMSDLDRFWGLLIDGSIVMKKIGENAKPIIDRIQEILTIIWRVQARAEELPSSINIPYQLPGGSKEV